ncbi:MAG: diiron oxygenase [Chrysiogenetes bacterium]|nr:diiron oxygenase [Chrysiogenetes bacterium]
MIRVQTAPEFSERLNRASINKRCYPWDKDVIDWSVPITDEYLYVPEEYSILYGTPAWDRLDFKAKSFVTRWEFTQLMRNAGAGEHLLNQAILAVLHHTDQYDPAWRFMLHEVAEECQHMAMFNHWTRLNADIKTKGLAGDKWGLIASMLTPFFATKAPVFFWMLTALFEVTGDDMARCQMKNAAGNLHPICQQMGRAHMIEEIRHIAFAQAWMENAIPKMSTFQRTLLSESAERITTQVLRIGFRLPYSSQIADHVSYAEFKAGIHSEHRRALFNRQITPTINDLKEVGVIRKSAIRAWEGKGLLQAAAC